MLIRKRSHHPVSFLLVLALLAFPAWSMAKRPPARRLPTLEQRIEAILRRSEARRGFWGVEVARIPSGEILYARNANRLFLPASNMKLFTTAAATEKLGPNFIFRTTVETDDEPDAQGRVGDLLLIGRGDPTFGSRLVPYRPGAETSPAMDSDLQKLADQVAAKGVREVTGNLIADDSYFLFEPYGHGWEQEDLQWGYGSPATALAFNDNALLLHVAPGAKVGERARVWLEPVADYYQLDNRVETAPASAEKRIFVERAPGSMQLDIWGEIPLGASGGGDTVAIANPPQLIGEFFRRALEARGIAVRGRVEVHHLTRIQGASAADPFPKPPPRIVLAEHASLPLRENIKVINKMSQNLHAEMLLRTLGREVKHFGTLTVGLEVLEEFAAEAGLERGGFRFADGSGLSRQALVTPHAIVRLLAFMARSPRFEAFFDSLPVAGVDGSLAERLRSPATQGRIRAKTGSMEHTNALSGYMDLPSGRRLAFSIIGNSHLLSSREAIAIIDRITHEISAWFTHQTRTVVGEHVGRASARGL